MILRLVKYSEIVDTIRLVTITHKIYFIAYVYLNKIEWLLNMYTLLFVLEKKLIKNTDILKNLYILQCIRTIYTETLKLH